MDMELSEEFGEKLDIIFVVLIASFIIMFWLFIMF